MKKMFLLILALAPSEVLSQKINVRSGAHEGFTRLVLDVPSSNSWTLQPTTNGAKLIVENHDEGFDTSRVFDKIDNTYLTIIQSNASELNLQFSCVCVANAFNANSTMIAIDISELAADPASKSPPVYTHNFTNRIFSEYKSPLSSTIRLMPTFRAFKRHQKRKSYAAVDDSQVFIIESLRDQEAVNNGTRLEDGQITLKKYFTESMIKALFMSRSSNIRNGHSEGKKLKLQRDTEGTAHSKIDEKSHYSKNSSNIQITLPINISSQNKRIEEIKCLNPDLLNFQNWDAKVDMIALVANINRHIYSESGNIDLEQVWRLAQAYLTYGFGTEAKDIISISNDLTQEDYALLSVADIIENRPEKYNRFPNALENCDDDFLLWRILSASNNHILTKEEIDSTLMALSKLPVQLRKIVGPQLSQRFLTAGNHEASAAVLRIIGQRDETKSPATQLEAAKLDMKKGQIKLAENKLLEIIGINSTQSAIALAHLVKFLIDRGDEVDGRTGSLIGAFSTELRGDPIADDLNRVHILALAKSGDFSEAFDVLAKEQVRNPKKSNAELHSELLNLLALQEDDITFLHHASIQMGQLQNEISKETLFILVERFQDLGFPEMSDGILERESVRLDFSDYSSEKIRQDLELSRPHIAPAVLSEMEEEISLRLEADASMRSGDFADADLAYRSIDDSPNSQYAAWLSNEWSNLIGEDAPVFGAFVKMANEKLEFSPQEERFMSNAEAAVHESRVTRDRIIRSLGLME